MARMIRNDTSARASRTCSSDCACVMKFGASSHRTSVSPGYVVSVRQRTWCAARARTRVSCRSLPGSVSGCEVASCAKRPQEESSMRIGQWLAASILCLLAATAHAHAHLTDSDPREGSAGKAPAQIVLTFSEAARLTALTLQKEGAEVRKLAPPTVT